MDRPRSSQARLQVADHATARSYVTAPIGAPAKSGMAVLFTVGAWYHDELVRTDHGWRISARVEESHWSLAAPPA